MFDGLYVILAIFMGFLANYGARFLPFLLFKNKKQDLNLLFLQKNMPLVIMVILVFYTLFALDFTSLKTALMALASCAFVLILQLYFKNALLSIFAGVLFYMLILRFF